MNKRIKKKKQKATYKIPKQIIRLARRWTEFDKNIRYAMYWICIDELNLPKKAIQNNIRKYNRICGFLEEQTGDGVFFTHFDLCHEVNGDPQGDGEYCDQSSGYFGDDFSGVYYYPIGENLYLSYDYEC
ncbi:hypothetical protein [Streptococcus dysgalactiae]|uniref:hypothetical protein n=1 Tax=Streptococcus dysgalactiae TaxID=1334 RepID=UPI000DCAADC4|nr:hypothetical protein [Streptococcus dysgalactiae]BBE40585.1 hypothetical protein FGCSD_1360 [Streptococcus dysgalactiae]